MEENVQLRTRLDEERSRTDAIRGQLTARTEGLQDRLERVQTERLEIERSHARRISELEELLRRAIEEYSRKTQQQVSQTAEAPTSRAVAAEADALAGS
jgi:predicted nuclease with TOPRIM domain